MVIYTLLSSEVERNACMLADYFSKNNEVKLITFKNLNFVFTSCQIK